MKLKEAFKIVALFISIKWNIPVFAQNPSIAAGNSSNHSLFLCGNGSVMACGANNYGQLGNGTGTGNVSTPTFLSSIGNVIAIAANNHSLFLKNDGTVWACGWNGNGGLGDGTTINRLTPIQIMGLSNIISIAAGMHHSLFLKGDGTVWACGYNTDGQLGDGTVVNKTTPIQVSGLNNVKTIAAGSYHSVFLKNDGTVWACGDNSDGQLGDNTTIDRPAPIQINSLSNVIAVAAGGSSHSLFVKGDGTAWAVGRNDDGQLGDGTTINKSTPVQVSSLSNIIGAAAGGYGYSLFLKQDGSAWACGWNGSGQLGDGTKIAKHTPIQVSSISNIITIAAGFEHSLFLKNDGTVWACGDNNKGQLGDGTVADKSTPILVPNLCASTSAVEEIGNQNIVSLYPNPFSLQTTLQSEKYLHNVSLMVDNYLGQTLIQQRNISGHSVVLQRDNLQGGLYLIRLMEGEQIITTKKIIIAD